MHCPALRSVLIIPWRISFDIEPDVIAKNSDLKTFRVCNAQLYGSTGGSTLHLQATVVDVLVDIIFFLDLVSRQVQRFDAICVSHFSHNFFDPKAAVEVVRSCAFERLLLMQTEQLKQPKPQKSFAGMTRDTSRMIMCRMFRRLRFQKQGEQIECGKFLPISLKIVHAACVTATALPEVTWHIGRRYLRT